MPAAVNRITTFAVDSALPALGRALWPSRCLVCGERGHARRDLCQPCAEALPWNRSACAHCALPLPVDAGQRCGHCLRHASPLHVTHAACVYAFPVDHLLPRFKFHRDLAAGRLLAQLMADTFGAHERPQALVPIPLHRNRLRARGYDQALELARPLARALRIPLCADRLQRIRATSAQSELSASARHRNLRGAFGVRMGSVLPTHVALIDDVMTTGATLHAAAKALHRAGVARVDAWVCARVP